MRLMPTESGRSTSSGTLNTGVTQWSPQARCALTTSRYTEVRGCTLSLSTRPVTSSGTHSRLMSRRSGRWSALLTTLGACQSSLSAALGRPTGSLGQGRAGQWTRLSGSGAPSAGGRRRTGYSISPEKISP